MVPENVVQVLGAAGTRVNHFPERLLDQGRRRREEKKCT